MKNSEDTNFGNGRISVCDELLLWTENEIRKIKAVSINGDTHKRATLSGQVRILSILKQYVKKKKTNAERRINRVAKT